MRPLSLSTFLLQLAGEEAAAKELIHARQVDIEFVDRCLFEQGYGVLHDLGDEVGIFAIGFHVAADDDGFGAEAAGEGHGHGAMDAEAAGFIATGGDDAAVAGAAYQQGLAFQFGVFRRHSTDTKKASRSKWAICRMVFIHFVFSKADFFDMGYFDAVDAELFQDRCR
jgi:hypothetical protein